MHEEPQAAPLLLKPGERALIEVDIVSVLEEGYCVKFPGVTPGLIHYVAANRRVVRGLT